MNEDAVDDSVGGFRGCSTVLIEHAREDEILSRGITDRAARRSGVSVPRGLLYRRVKEVVGHSQRSCASGIADWRICSNPNLTTGAIDEIKMSVEDDEVYVWTAVDVETFKVAHIDASPGRSDLDALLFIKQVLNRCRGQPNSSSIATPDTTGRLTTSISATHTVKRGRNGP